MQLIRLGAFAAIGMLFVTEVRANQESDWSTVVPAGWKMIQNVAEGQNAVLLIEENDPAKFIANDGLGAKILNTNPRKLLFLRKMGGGFQLAGSAIGFLPSAGDIDDPCVIDPLEEGGINLSKGVLTISMGYWASCGGYGVSRSSYKFRLEGGRYRLIGLDELTFSRASGEGDETSINFLTGRKSFTSNVQVIQVDDYEKPVERRKIWSRVRKEKYFLDTMKRDDCDGLASDPSWCLTD